jgi:hypothetical protein
VVASTVVRRDRLRRWSLVAGAAAVLVVVPTVVEALPVEIAPIEPARLAEKILRSAQRPYQGYAESSGRLGVPELPNLTQVSSLLTGTTRIRSWYDSPTRWRFDVLSPLGNERDTYGTPLGEAIWDYGANLLTQVVGDQPVRLPRAGDVLPPDLARRVLSAAAGDPLSPLPARREAGVSAAGLRVRPADPDTSIGQVDIWADPDTGLPVRVEVSARGADQPVLVSRFLELTQSRPEASVLTLDKPVDGGFTVTSEPDIARALGGIAPVLFPDRLAGRSFVSSELVGLPGIGQYGTGLSTFVVLALPGRLAGSTTEAARKAGASDLALPGGTGVLLSVPPVSVVIARSSVARRSYLLAGLVVPSVLSTAAAELSTVPRGGA